MSGKAFPKVQEKGARDMTEHPRSGGQGEFGTMPGVPARRRVLVGGSGMRSPRGFLASVVLVMALPVAILIQALLGSGASLTMHPAPPDRLPGSDRVIEGGRSVK